MLISIKRICKNFFCCPFVKVTVATTKPRAARGAPMGKRRCYRSFCHTAIYVCGCYINIISVFPQKQVALYCKRSMQLKPHLWYLSTKRNMPVPKKTDSAYNPIRIKLIDVGNVVICIVGNVCPISASFMACVGKNRILCNI